MAWRADINQEISTMTHSSQMRAYAVISEESPGAYYFFTFNADDELMLGDYCYFSLTEAKAHGYEFHQIKENSWYECPPPNWDDCKSVTM